MKFSLAALIFLVGFVSAGSQVIKPEPLLTTETDETRVPNITTKPTTTPSTTTVTTVPTTQTPTTTVPTTPPTTPSTTTPTTTASTTSHTTTSAPTKPAPTEKPTSEPTPDRRFDAPSFIGGFVLAIGLVAIAFVSWKFYMSRHENYYHTL